jgi:hypothetical protein
VLGANECFARRTHCKGTLICENRVVAARQRQAELELTEHQFDQVRELVFSRQPQ